MCLCGEASERAIYLESVRGRGGPCRGSRDRRVVVGRVGVGVTGLVNVSLYFVRLCDGLAGSRHPMRMDVLALRQVD